MSPAKLEKKMETEAYRDDTGEVGGGFELTTWWLTESV